MTESSRIHRPLRYKLLIAVALILPFIFTSLLTAVHLIRVIWINLLFHPFLVQRQKSKDTPEKYGMSFENVVLGTPEGLLLSAWYIPARTGVDISDRTIIVSHGVRRSKTFFLPMVRFLHRLGYNLLMFDMRAHGQSEGGKVSFGYDEQYDIDAAIDYLKRRDRRLIKRLGILAHSMGAASAVFAAARRREIRAMVLICCFADIEWNMTYWITRLGHLPYWPFVPIGLKSFKKEIHSDLKQASPIYYVSKLKLPLFFIHSERDQLTDPLSSEKLYEKAQEPKQLWYVPKARHEGFYSAAPQEFEKRVGGFFGSYL